MIPISCSTPWAPTSLVDRAAAPVVVAITCCRCHSWWHPLLSLVPRNERGSMFQGSSVTWRGERGTLWPLCLSLSYPVDHVDDDEIDQPKSGQLQNPKPRLGLINSLPAALYVRILQVSQTVRQIKVKNLLNFFCRENVFSWRWPLLVYS